MKTVSIVIVNWNHRTLLYDLLTSLFAHPPSRDYEVIVIDNDSADDSREMVRTQFPAVKLLVNPSNMGFARAVNRAIGQSSGQYVLLLNTDVIVLEGAIDAQIEFMEAHPHCAFCGGLLLNGDGVPQDVYGQFPSIKSLVAEIIPDRFKSQGRISLAPRLDQSRPMPVDFVSGCSLMVGRPFFESAGLMDEQFFMYFEDADWGFRAKQLGWEVFFVPSAHYIHFGQGSVGWAGIKNYWVPSLGLLLRKHYHGLKFATHWPLYLLLRIRYAWYKFRLRTAQNRASRMAVS